MIDFLSEYGARMAAWTPLVLVVLGVLSAWGIWYNRRNKPGAERHSGRRRVVKWACVQFLGLSIVGLFVAYGPMSPLFKSAARLEGRLGEPVPDTSFRLVAERSEQTLSNFRGKVLLVNLWATWCPPCRQELPTLSRLQAAYRERGLVVLTLSDERPEDLLPVLEKLAPETVNGYVDSFGWLAIETFRPFTLLVDQSGILRDYVFGVQDYDVFEGKILRYIQ